MATDKTKDTPKPDAEVEKVLLARMIYGFHWTDFTSSTAFVKLAHKPMAPYGLAAMRILFGSIMLIDLFGERGVHEVDTRWGDPDNQCYFPLFNFLFPLPLHWMYLIHIVMLVGLFGIIFGCLYRVSCLMFLIPYWYIFCLDKLTWNNHSYLYGLVASILFTVDSNRAWSIDGYIWPEIRNSHVPAWNYGLLRMQFFLVYFIAGLKKTDTDWVGGYSMNRLSSHWVFAQLRILVTRELIDYLVVHIGGLFIDLSMGYLLYFDVTRVIGFAIGLSFNFMNSQIFSIGMFPWTMMAAMPIYCSPDWPIKILRKFVPLFRSCTDRKLGSNSHCLYEKNYVKPEDTSDSSELDCVRKGLKPPQSHAGLHHKLASSFVVIYVAIQIFLPYSHFITKGYNNWTQGLYGYSWDMMVHSWKQQHLRITYRNVDTGEIGYLNPSAWTSSPRSRWNSHADMVKQYGSCVEEKLKLYNLTNIQLYVDVWKSMNGRFQQRMFDPRVDVITAEWHPLRATSWVLPLLYDLSEWREDIRQISRNLSLGTNYTDAVFVADFPGLSLENYVQKDLNLTTLHILKGKVRVEIMDVMEKSEKNISLNAGSQVDLLPGTLHNVHTISDTPSCYVYKFINKTHEDLMEKVDDFEKKVDQAMENGTDLMNLIFDDPNVENYKILLLERRRSAGRNRISLSKLWKGFKGRIHHFMVISYKCVLMTMAAVETVVTGEDMRAIMIKSNLTERVKGMDLSLRNLLLNAMPS